MSNFINIQLTDNAAAVLARLKAYPAEMSNALCRALDRENELTIGYIQQYRMSQRGPFTLGVVTNRLRSSLRRTDATISGNEITSAIGSNVVYMGVHEFGFDGDVTVKSYTRRCAIRDVVKIGPRGGKKKIASGIATVKSFTRHMVMPERAPIRLGIHDRRQAYTQALSRAVISAWQGGNS